MNDPKALVSGGAGGTTALLGFLSISDIAAAVGIITAIITCGVYIWSAKKRIEIQEEMKKEQEIHHKKVRDIQREKEES